MSLSQELQLYMQHILGLKLKDVSSFYSTIFITDPFLPPTADVEHHRGNALPNTVVWSKDKPGKDKPRSSPFSVPHPLTLEALLCPVPHNHTDLCFCHGPLMLCDCQRVCLFVFCSSCIVYRLRLKPNKFRYCNSLT